MLLQSRDCRATPRHHLQDGVQKWLSLFQYFHMLRLTLASLRI